jgi:hypothetical protein
VVTGVHVVRDVDRGGSISVVRHTHSDVIVTFALDKAVIITLTVGKIESIFCYYFFLDTFITLLFLHHSTSVLTFPFFRYFMYESDTRRTIEKICITASSMQFITGTINQDTPSCILRLIMCVCVCVAF